MRFCVWLAPNMEELKKTFSDMDVSWESMHEVEETKPDLWGEKKWKEHLEAEATADTLGDWSQLALEDIPWHFYKTGWSVTFQNEPFSCIPNMAEGR